MQYLFALYMNMGSSTQFAPSRNMAICDPVHQITMWEDAIFRSSTHITPNNAAVMQSEYASHESSIPVDNQGDSRGNIPEKAQRRLAQNREAARKSRMRKKAYVQQLEVSRLKLAQLELELERAKQQHACIGGVGGSFGSNRMLNPGSVTFEIEYGHWIEEQEAKTSELRNVLQSSGINDVELHVVVENVLNHYHDLFRIKSEAVKADVFYLVSGVWRTSVESFFFWIGGFRPSELVKVVMPHLQPLTDQQVLNVCNLRHSCQQAEDALSQGIDKLQQNLAQSIAVDITGLGDYSSYMAAYIEQLEALETFVNQADHLRQQTLQQMSRILTTRQTARGLLACGEYFQRLRALSSLWAARPQEIMA